MILASSLYSCKISHHRFGKRKHSFKNSFFWFALKNSELNNISNSGIKLVGIEKFSLYKFSYLDHMDFNQGSLSLNLSYYLRSQGLSTKIRDFTIYTNLSFIGYIFNPMSIILVELEDNKKCAVIEIGNTFNEIKPYFVSPDCFKNNNFQITVQKLFYISPFIDHRNYMTFNFRTNDSYFSLEVIDFKLEKDGKKEIILRTELKGEQSPLTRQNIIRNTLKHPFNTLYIIFFIHFHALILMIKKVKFYKKNEYQESQKGALKWKK